MFNLMLFKFYLVHLAVDEKDTDKESKKFLEKLHPKVSDSITADTRELERDAAEELEREPDFQEDNNDEKAETDEAFEETITRHLLSS